MKLTGFALIAIITFVMALGQASDILGETPNIEHKVTLTQEEADLVRWLIKNDSMIQELATGQKALAWMNKVASAAPGPIGILAKWNMGTLKGWRMANQNLAKLKQQVTCARIDLMLASETDNKDFFDHLYDARGCNEQ